MWKHVCFLFNNLHRQKLHNIPLIIGLIWRFVAENRVTGAKDSRRQPLEQQ